MNILALLSEGLGAPGGTARYNQDLIAAHSCSARVSEVAILPRFALEHAATPAKVRQLAHVPGRTAWRPPLPDRILSFAKTGFVAPISCWMQSEIGHVEALLWHPRSSQWARQWAECLAVA